MTVLNHSGKTLGIDYGARSIGLAVSDVSQCFVFGRGVLKVNPQKGMQEIFKKIADLVKTENVQDIVIGLPFDAEGKETAQTKHIRKFGERLCNFIPDLAVHFEDESFTSFEADQILKESSMKPAQKKDFQHELAAMIILKKFLKIS